jgi:hypothetical protein
VRDGAPSAAAAPPFAYESARLKVSKLQSDFAQACRQLTQAARREERLQEQLAALKAALAGALGAGGGGAAGAGTPGAPLVAGAAELVGGVREISRARDQVKGGDWALERRGSAQGC